MKDKEGSRWSKGIWDQKTHNHDIEQDHRSTFSPICFGIGSYKDDEEARADEDG